MRYLKIYEEFDPSDSIKEDIKDIFIDLTDKYFDIKVDDFGKIEISKNRTVGGWEFQYQSSLWDIDSDVIDSVLRLIDYLRTNKLYLNDMIIQRKTIKTHPVTRLKRAEVSDHGVVNVDERGFMILADNYVNDITGEYEKEWVTEPIHKIIIKYSNRNL